MFAGLSTPVGKITRAVNALVESQGMRGASRTFQIKRRELGNWLTRAGSHCHAITNSMKVAHVTFLEYDELYTYVSVKSFRNYVWTCIDAVSKLWLGLHVSFERSYDVCKTFFKTFEGKVSEIAGATSDGLAEYATIMAKRFPSVPFAQIVKVYENERLVEVTKKQCGKFTVADVEFVITKLKLGSELNTSAIERLNTTLRSFLARLNRKTIKYSKLVGNLVAFLNVFQAYYNFCLVGSTTKTTPACKAGLAEKRLSLRELLTLRR